MTVSEPAVARLTLTRQLFLRSLISNFIKIPQKTYSSTLGLRRSDGRSDGRIPISDFLFDLVKNTQLA
jgi:hypothetical protein